MPGKSHSTARTAATIVSRSCAIAGALCIVVALYFIARGFGLYKEAITQTSLDDMAARIEQQAGFTPIDELPDLYLQATVAVEDHRFYAHPGFDAIATARALVNDLRAGAIVEGGSTITQQLAKNQYFTQEQTIERKVAEVLMALTMEQHFSKQTILELYVNSIYFGDGHTGIGAASEGYFGKKPADLTPDECTLLVGIPNAPSAYALSEHPELARQRQGHVLEKLVAYGYMGRGDARLIAAQAAAKEPLAWQGT
ncbi:glycosyl transferase [Gordonibacter sp. An230]|uniref:transglycosylase domain-containing protein n=1 Tax=Gordonibacter sp. An230 TaxID=1965592 RepID=UPI000B55D149|nr:biosynthetic peptidoglycan transglycosylase [Gordonibacter sp. An230]OUO91795.1 glycosyl transferase [Gordonibacter sp. An230]